MKSVLITEANKGIGLAPATLLAQKGYRFFLGSRNVQTCLHVIEALRSAGIVNVEGLQLNVPTINR